MRMWSLIALMLIGTTVHGREAPISQGPQVLVLEVVSESRVPVAGAATIITRSLLKVNLRRDPDGGWTQHQELCAIDIESDTKAQTVLPPTFIQAVPTRTYPVTIEFDGKQWVYRADPGPNHIGYDPSLSGGVVPRRKSDPGVVDFEADGHPGATVHLQVPVIGSVRMYIAQRGWPLYQGVIENGVVRGEVASNGNESRTLGASIGLFAVSPTISPIASLSRFHMEPLSDASVGCPELEAAWTRSFSIPAVEPNKP